MNDKSLATLDGVRSGINLIFIGLILTALTIALSVAGTFLAALSGSATMVMLATFGPAVLMLVVSGLNLVGKILCLSTPEEVGGKGLITASVVFDVLIALVGIAQLVATVPGYVGSLSGLFGLVSYVLFLLYAKRLAVYLDATREVERAGQALKSMLWLFILGALSVVGIFVFPPIVLVFGLVMLILGILAIVYYCVLIVGLRGTLGRLG